MNLNMTNKSQYSLLYEMLSNFQASYYAKEMEPILNVKIFKTTASRIVFDCSKQNESLKYARVDVCLEFESS